jgi:preprotein translocase subunit SecB
MDKFKSKLRFKNYIVKNVNFEYNEDFKDDSAKLDIEIDRNIEYIKNEMIVTLMVDLFSRTEKKYPFKMNVEVKGFFQIENNDENINFEPNAIAILYPYVRAIVSTYTSNANVMPLILPPVNVNKLLEEKEKEEKSTLKD